jgi:hypothetical protein
MMKAEINKAQIGFQIKNFGSATSLKSPFKNKLYFFSFCATLPSGMPFHNRMHIKALVLVLSVLGTLPAIGQMKKHFVVNEGSDYRKVYLTLSAPSSSLFIRPGRTETTLMVYGQTELSNVEPLFQTEYRNNALHADFKLINPASRNSERTLAWRMLNSTSKKPEDRWNIYLSENNPYDLDLHYGVGNAYLDLSGLAIEKLKIHTGSADVKVGYVTGVENIVEMDSFMVKVDLGSLEINKLNLAKARHIFADVGFGSLTLDFSDKMLLSSEIFASVGAGRLEIIIPSKEPPMKIKLNSSPLCTVKLPKSFIQTDKNVFINYDQKDGTEPMLTFNVDVAMGSFIFRQSK